MKDRVVWVDYAKIIGMYLVILGHLYPTLSTTRLYIYGFHMPLFFLLSGIFHKKSSTIDILKYTKQLFIPFLFFQLAYIILYVCYVLIFLPDTHFIQIITSQLKQLVYNFIYSQAHPNIYTWFLIVLLYNKISMDIILLFQKKIQLIIIVLTMFVAYYLRDFPYCYISNSLMSLPFYYLGYSFLKNRTNYNVSKWMLFSIGIILIVVSFIISDVNGRVSMWGRWFGNIPVLFYINGLIGSASIITFSMLFKRSKTIENLSKATITMLGAQQPFIMLTISLSAYLNDTGVPFFFILSAVIILFICYFIHIFLQKNMPFSIGKSK